MTDDRLATLERAVAALLCGFGPPCKAREKRLALVASGAPIRFVVEVARGTVAVRFEEDRT
jgi:hypothetical protein